MPSAHRDTGLRVRHLPHRVISGRAPPQGAFIRLTLPRRARRLARNAVTAGRVRSTAPRLRAALARSEPGRQPCGGDAARHHERDARPASWPACAARSRVNAAFPQLSPVARGDPRFPPVFGRPRHPTSYPWTTTVAKCHRVAWSFRRRRSRCTSTATRCRRSRASPSRSPSPRPAATCSRAA